MRIARLYQITLIFLIGLLVASCDPTNEAKHEDLVKQHHAAMVEIENLKKEKLRAETERNRIQGDVFIVTKGQESVKLPLITVELYTRKQLLTHCQKRDVEANKGLAALTKTIKEQENLVRQKKVESSNLEAKYQNASELASKANPTTDAEVDGFIKAIDAQTKALEASTSAKIELTQMEFGLSSLKSQAEQFNSASYFFESRPKPVYSVKTNADGKFEIPLAEVEHGEGLYLLARAKRTVGSSSEEYFWVVPVEKQGQPSGITSSLNNDNMVTTRQEVAHLVDQSK